jgi:hypothetical protein
MNQGTLATEKTLRLYLALLAEVMLNLRKRMLCGESLDRRELDDLLGALNNIPEMLCAYGGWTVEENINRELERYDSQWFKADAGSPRCSLMKTLRDETARMAKHFMERQRC